MPFTIIKGKKYPAQLYMYTSLNGSTTTTFRLIMTIMSGNERFQVAHN